MFLLKLLQRHAVVELGVVGSEQTHFAQFAPPLRTTSPQASFCNSSAQPKAPSYKPEAVLHCEPFSTSVEKPLTVSQEDATHTPFLISKLSLHFVTV